MNKKRFFVITIIALLLLNSATLIYLFTSRQNGPTPGKGPGDYMIKQLDFDQRQQQQFAGLREAHQQLLHQIRDEDHRLHEVYFNLLKTTPANRNAADSIAGLIAMQRKAIEMALFDHFASLKTICYPAQQQKLNSIIDDLARHIAPGEGGRPLHP